ncbi:hypothetical protein PCS_03576 [Desulfocurvibacter africanus PCS]|uniref:DUF2382 domain-containing protein n=1 Tax=Desulfocurvibacter africanus PCS TaxID=1262666 RepID=M5PP56_DESAF|nr:YsnF/AvaK domain-containing protein [Desulfocurvibacter africanus]EMG35749.1 hypothetical protein PCS_03576 [Desulfocurvibacter africanus PCS]
MAKTVAGFMDTPMSAQDVVQDLVTSGFSRNDISLLMIDKTAGHGGYSWKTADKSRGGDARNARDDLTSMGIPADHADYYLEGVRRGGVLITVSTDDDSADRAADIMHRKGAIDIDRRSEQWKATGWKRFDERAAPYTTEEIARERETILPVTEEEIHVGKREVERGTVRAYTRVVEQPVEEQVRLREEHATVERRPVDRPLTDADRESAFREQTIEVRETSEEPVVSKEARVTEEVHIGKEATERTETVREKARKTKVEVEQGARGRGRRPGA